MSVVSRDHLLPTELWEACCKHLGRSDLRNLAQVDRFLNGICLPSIFRGVKCLFFWIYSAESPGNLSTNEHQENYGQLNRSCHSFKEIAASKKHAILVWKCIASFYVDVHQESQVWPEDAVQWKNDAYEQYVQILITCLPSFSNLREIVIYGFRRQVDARMVIALSELPKLQRVTFREVVFSGLSIRPRLELQKLTVENRPDNFIYLDDSSVLDIICSQHIRDLDVDFAVHTTRIFRALQDQGGCPQLTRLSVVIRLNDGTSAFYSFLASCPNLETICVHSDDLSDTDSLPLLPMSAVPSLGSFYGPAPLAIVLIPGRPVEKVVISTKLERHLSLSYPLILKITEMVDRHYFEHLFSFIRRSTCAVTDLFISYMPCRRDFMPLITQSFPQLKRVTLDLVVCKGHLPPRFCQGAFSPFLPIQSLLDEQGNGENLGHPQDTMEDGLYPARLQCSYMQNLHWLSVSDIPLPPNLETLRFRHDFDVPFPVDDTAELMALLHGRPYKLQLAKVILNRLSERYKALSEIQVVGEDEELSWRWNGREVGWAYEGVSTRRNRDPFNLG